MDDYCNFCGVETPALSKTYNGKAICKACAWNFRFCEICGTLETGPDQKTEDIHHFDQDCFK